MPGAQCTLCCFRKEDFILFLEGYRHGTAAEMQKLGKFELFLIWVSLKSYFRVLRVFAGLLRGRCSELRSVLEAKVQLARLRRYMGTEV